jgi:hypothetical protein
MRSMDFLMLTVPVLTTILSLYLFVKFINKEYYTLAGVSLLGIALGFGIVSMYYSARSNGFEASALLLETILDIVGAIVLSTLLSVWLPMFIFVRTFPFFENIRNSQDNHLLPWIINIGFLSAIALIVKYFVRSAWFSNILFGLPNNPFECIREDYISVAAGSYGYLDKVCNIRLSLFINRLSVFLGDNKPLANAMTILGGVAAVLSLVLQIQANTGKQQNITHQSPQSEHPDFEMNSEFRKTHKRIIRHTDEFDDDIDDYKGEE